MVAVLASNVESSPVYDHVKQGTLDELLDTMVHYNREYFFTRDFLRMFMYLILDNVKLARRFYFRVSPALPGE